MFHWRALPANEEDFPDPYGYTEALNSAQESPPVQNVTFTLGECEHCDALEIAISTMRCLETSVVRCGARGCANLHDWTDEQLGLKPSPPPGTPEAHHERYAPIDMLITLCRCEEEKDNVMNMSPGERVAYARGRKDAAAKYFKAERYASALDKYKMAVAILDFQGDFENEISIVEAASLKQAAKQNQGACFLKLGDTAGAIKVCTEVLKDAPESDKSLYRRAMAYLKQARYSDAECDLKRCLQVSPQNHEARRLLAQCKTESKKAASKEKTLATKMLSEGVCG